MNDITVSIPNVGDINVEFVTGPEIHVKLAGEDGQPGVGVPSGGTTGQVLAKKSDTNFDTEWQTPSSGGVTDVQVNGSSVVNNGVANVPVASASDLGAIKIPAHGSSGLYVDNGALKIYSAGSSTIKGGSNQYEPIVPYMIGAAAFYGLARAAGIATANDNSSVGNYTETAKSKISEMLSAPVTVTGTTPTITALSGIQYVCGEVATLDITLPASGIVDVVFESGSTPTVLTITPPTGMTVEWANGFDSTALEADTLYELNIKMVGTKCLGVAGAWS